MLLVSQVVLHTLSIAKSGYLLESGKNHFVRPADQLLADRGSSHRIWSLAFY